MRFCSLYPNVYIYIYMPQSKFLQNACDHMLTPQCSRPLFLTPRDVGRFRDTESDNWLISQDNVKSQNENPTSNASDQLEMKLL